MRAAAGIRVLRSQTLLALVDPQHGGEVLELVDLRTGASLLGRPPFAPGPPVIGDLDEMAWTTAYRGGWQVVAPNAGEAAGGHPFHGAASVEPWSVLDEQPTRLRMGWQGHGLVALRTLTVDDRGIEAETEWRPARSAPVPMVAVEHLTVGLAVLDPEVRLVLPGGRALELDDRPGDLALAAPWPEAALLDGTRGRMDRWALSEAGARFLVVTDLPDGRVEVLNTSSGCGLVLEWDVGAMPHLWLWREARASGGPWRGRAEILGIEPSSVPHAAGLAEAAASGHAVTPTAAEPFRQRLRVTVLPARG